MNDSEKKSEEILSRALWQKEQGKTLPEILALSPEGEKEIKGMFESIAALEAKKDELNPASEILQRILFNLPDQSEVEAKKIASNIKGRVFFGLNLIKESFMTQKLKIAIPVLAVLVLIAAGAYVYLGGNQAGGTMAADENEIAAALDRELAQEAALAEQSDADANVALADEQIINEFNQTYDDSQL